MARPATGTATWNSASLQAGRVQMPERYARESGHTDVSQPEGAPVLQAVQTDGPVAG